MQHEIEVVARCRFCNKEVTPVLILNRFPEHDIPLKCGSCGHIPAATTDHENQEYFNRIRTLINETSKPNPLAEALVAADSMAAKIELPFDISIRARKGD
jgi:hypothetical protein